MACQIMTMWCIDYNFMAWFKQIFNFRPYTKFSNTEHLSSDFLQGIGFN